MKRCLRVSLIAVCAAAVSLYSADTPRPGADAPKAAEPRPASAAEKAEKLDTIKLGTVSVVPSERCVLVPITTVLDSGILEFFAVTKRGHGYESSLIIDCDERSLHAALLLLTDTTTRETGKGPPAGGDSGSAEVFPGRGAGRVSQFEKLDGDTVSLNIVARSGDVVRTVPALDIITDRGKSGKTGDRQRGLHWIFNGSESFADPRSGQMVHASRMTGNVVALIYDSYAEINLSEPAGIPYRGPDLGFEVNREAIAGLAGSDLLLRIEYRP